MNTINSNYKELKKALKDIKIADYKYLGNGYAEYKNQKIDLTATAPNHLCIAYTTLKQIN